MASSLNPIVFIGVFLSPFIHGPLNTAEASAANTCPPLPPDTPSHLICPAGQKSVMADGFKHVCVQCPHDEYQPCPNVNGEGCLKKRVCDHPGGYLKQIGNSQTDNICDCESGWVEDNGGKYCVRSPADIKQTPETDGPTRPPVARPSWTEQPARVKWFWWVIAVMIVIVFSVTGCCLRHFRVTRCCLREWKLRHKKAQDLLTANKKSTKMAQYFPVHTLEDSRIDAKNNNEQIVTLDPTRQPTELTSSGQATESSDLEMDAVPDRTEMTVPTSFLLPDGSVVGTPISHAPEHNNNTQTQIQPPGAVGGTGNNTQPAAAPPSYITASNSNLTNESLNTHSTQS